MKEELVNEINQEISLLIDSGFYKEAEILELIEEQFIDEKISLDSIAKYISNKYNEKIANEKNWLEITDFDRLKDCFNRLNKKKIIAIHNAGYTIEEGVDDAFQIFYHISNQKLSSNGFCFYHFQDIEQANESEMLSLSFGDFKNSEEKSLEIGKIIVDILKNNGFSINWDEDINKRIEIKPFKWEKRFDDYEYEMEGAVNSFIANQK